jgi:hypothetical protein
MALVHPMWVEVPLFASVPPAQRRWLISEKDAAAATRKHGEGQSHRRGQPA